MSKLTNIADELLISQAVPKYIPLVIKDLAKFRMTRHLGPTTVIEERKDSKGYIRLKFRNKGIEMINLPQILNSKVIKGTIPNFIEHKEPPIVSYAYPPTIGQKNFNFRKTMKHFNFDINVSDLPCTCKESPFIDKDIGHVVTGNLRIIKDRKLRQLIEKGPSYREQRYINWDLNLKDSMEAVRDYKTRWAKQEMVDIRVLDEWEGRIITAIRNKIDKIRNKHKMWRKRVRKQILRDQRHLKYLDDFQEQYVLVPADKASNNVIVVCKKYYLEVVVNELHNDDSTACKTYEEHLDEVEPLISTHLHYMQANNIKVPSTMCKLPTFYWLPKMHKKPIGSRFIAASSSCTTKALSRMITKCLSLIIQHYKEYNEGIMRNSGANCFWIIDNSTEVLKKLDKINDTGIARHFDSFDFSTLYTNIPHDLLLDCIDTLVTEAYRIRGANYISIHGAKSFWSDQAVDGCINVELDKIIDHIHFLIDNIYIGIGNRIFKQVIGIPMGTDCAPLLANLFLFHYEYQYIKDKLKHNHKEAILFRHTVRYIDDLLTLNNPFFEEEIPKIYPKQLTLKKTTESQDRLSYLDICIEIKDRKFTTSVYDKRDTFEFYIVNFPYLDSNIPSGPAYGVYMSQLVRIGRICKKYGDFKERHRRLTTRLLKQGYKYDRLCTLFKRFSHKYIDIFSKFGTTVKEHVKGGIALPMDTVHGITSWITSRRK